MAERKSRRGRLVLLLLSMSAAQACGQDVESQARLIDDMCAGEGCAVEGSARRTSGVSQDSTGFVLGPGSGSLRMFVLPFAEPGDSSFELDLLVSGRGGYTARLVRIADNCTPVTSDACVAEVVDDWTEHAVRGEYEWVPSGAYLSGSSGQTFRNFRLDVRVDNDGSEVEIADVRYDTFDSIDCSVYAPGARR